MRIEGSVALVTGANRGFGRQLTEQLVARGAAKVYAAARNPETITTAGVVPIRIDITDPASVAAAAAAATDVNLLINNAGTAGSFNGLLTGPLDDIREQMETHYFGTLTVTRAFAPYLQANAPAAILNVLSVLSWAHLHNVGAYSAAKAAEWGQTDAVRDELAPSGVAVTALHVGFMDTDMVAHVDAPKNDPAAIAAAALDGVENGLVEVLGDDLTRQVKAGLAADRGVVAPVH
ncbi:MAG: SDR family oxidoreductase [Mycobacterium sp.]|jgi:NAD(P)-dependent dehydrogenase (short-subunit alcohol dehydrogenase family)